VPVEFLGFTVRPTEEASSAPAAEDPEPESDAEHGS